MRDKLKGIVPRDDYVDYDGVPVSDTPQWSVGDMPITWNDSELKRLHKKTLRDNYKRGVITYITYRKMLRGE